MIFRRLTRRYGRWRYHDSACLGHLHPWGNHPGSLHPVLGDDLPDGWRMTADFFHAWTIIGSHVLELGYEGRTGDGCACWQYRLITDDVVIFDDDHTTEVRGKVGAGDFVRTARGVLAVLAGASASVTGGWTPVQRAWHRTHAEELARYAMPGRCGYCGAGHDTAGCPSLDRSDECDYPYCPANCRCPAL